MSDSVTKVVLATLDDCIRSSPLRRKLVIDRLREVAVQNGGKGDFGYWRSRYDDYFADGRRHHAPPHLFTIAIEECGEAPWLTPWIGHEQRVKHYRRIEEASREQLAVSVARRR